MSSGNEIDNLINTLRMRSRAAREESARQLESCGEVVIPRLEAVLMESTGVVAETAALILSRIGIPAIPALAKALREGGHNRRKYASIALAHIGAAAIPVLEAAAMDEDRGVRWRAFNALARIGIRNMPFIVARLLDSDQETRLEILSATEAQLTSADTADSDQWDAERSSIVPCLIRRLELTDPNMLRFGNGMLQKVGLPSIDCLAEYVLNCRNEVAETNCVHALRSLLYGCIKESEEAGNILLGYTAALFKKAPYLAVAHAHLSNEDYRQAFDSGDSRVCREQLGNAYLLLFADLGILAVPVLAPAWLKETKEKREFSDRAMDIAFRGWLLRRDIPHIPYVNPKNYRGPTSPDDRIFSEADPGSMEDVDKIVSALEYKYEKMIDDLLEKRETEPNGSTRCSSASELRKSSKTLSLVRERAIQTVQDKGVMMLPCIIEMVENGDDDRCLCALEALSLINGIDTGILNNNPKLLSVLIRFMKMPHDWYRIRVIASANHMGQPLLPFLSQYASKARNELDTLGAIAVMGSIGWEARAYVEPFMFHSNMAIGAFSRWYLAKIAADE